LPKPSNSFNEKAWKGRGSVQKLDRRRGGKLNSPILIKLPKMNEIYF